MSIFVRMTPEQILEFFEREDIKSELEKMKAEEWYKDWKEKLFEEYQQFLFNIFQPAEDAKVEAMKIFPREFMEISAETYLMAVIVKNVNAETLESAKKSVKMFLTDEEFICGNLNLWCDFEIKRALHHAITTDMRGSW